jgi:predicted TIM-barrel fold metal-dependent hydrolase
VILDGHVTLGENRDASLALDELLATMADLGIDRALVSPAEPFVAVRHREGNALVAAAAASSGGRLLAYAVATPWLGAGAVDELRRAHAAGAAALKLDPALQGFDLLDGLVDPLLAFAADVGWPVYVRTGTPPHALPLQVAWLAARYPGTAFVLGKSGATDFSHDGPAALAVAANLLADSAWVEWPTALAAAEPGRWGGRVVFTTDAPFSDPAVELARAAEAPVPAAVRGAILGGTLAAVLHR